MIERPIFRIRLRTRLVPVLVGLLLLIVLFDSYAGWWAVFVSLGGGWLLSYFWARSLGRGLTLKREVRFGWAHVGDILLQRFTLINRHSFPALWVEVNDGSTMPLYRASRGLAVGGGRSIRWHTEAICTRRGLFQLGPLTMHTGDPLGLYSVAVEYPITIPLLVLPPIVPLPPIELAAGGRAGERGARSATSLRTVSASQVREYQPTDHHRLIHWPTSARQNKLFVRQLDGAEAGDLWILLDMHRDVHLGNGENSTEEHQVILAASLADQALRNGKAVGLAAAGGDLTWLHPRGGGAQRWQILYSLALSALGEWPLSMVLERVRPILGSNSSLTIITPSVDPKWVESLVPIVEHGATPTALILDPISFGGTDSPRHIREVLHQLGVTSYGIPRTLLEEVTGQLAGHWPATAWHGTNLGYHYGAREPWRALL